MSIASSPTTNTQLEETNVMSQFWNKADMVCRLDDNGNPELVVRVDGMVIAKRGLPDTPQAKTWIPLEPGFRVIDGKKKRDGQELRIEYDPPGLAS
jgi:hypothetical protein